MTAEQLRAEIAQAVVAWWAPAEGHRIRVGALLDNLWLVEVMEPGDWQGQCLVPPIESDADLEAAIAQAREDLDTKRSGVRRARRYS